MGRMKSASLSQKAYSLMMFLAVSVLAGLLLSGLAVPMTALAGSSVNFAADSLDEIPTDLETPAQSERSRVLMANGEVLATFYDENRIYVPLSEISPLMQDAQIGIEDHRFYEHGAIDFQGFGRALVKTLTGDTQGASTLTQQYVKLVRLETAMANGDEEAARKAVEVTIERKIIEMRYSMALEERLTKDQILERYLNIAYYGDGAYGVESAAQHYFRTTAKDLTLGQSALLAGIVQNPVAFNPVKNTQRALDRRDVVLNQMVKWKMITEAEAAEAKLETFDPAQVLRTPNGCVSSQYAFLCDYVRLTLLSDKMTSLGKDKEERERALKRGGLTIQTKINPTAQDSAEAAVATKVAPTDPVIGNAVLLEPSTGLIIAMAQSRPKMGDGEGETYWNYNVPASMGGMEGFQAGSTFKAFTMAAAMEQGVTPGHTYNAPGKLTFEKGAVFRDCQGTFKLDEEWDPENQGGRGYGTIDMVKAAKSSVNTYFIQLIQSTGICASIDMAAKVGVELSDGQTLRSMQRYPSFVLGTAYVTPLSMAEAYATFANRGVHCDPIILESVTTQEGKALDVPSANCQKVMEPEVADGVNYVLKQVAGVGGTGYVAALRDGRDEAGKTGTTNGNEAVWYAGYTPEVAGVAMIAVENANPIFKDGTKKKTLRNLKVAAGYLDGSGGRDAGAIWKAAMKAALKDKPKTKFTAPSDEIMKGVKVPVPSVKGMGYNEAKATLEAAGFTTSRWSVYSDRPQGTFLGITPTGSALKFSTIRLKVSAGPAPAQPETPATDPAAPPGGQGDQGGNQGGGGPNR